MGFLCAALVLGSVLTTLSSVLFFRSYVNERISETNSAALQQVSGEIDFIRDGLADISTFMCISPEVQLYMQGRTTDMPGLVINQLVANRHLAFTLFTDTDGNVRDFVLAQTLDSGSILSDFASLQMIGRAVEQNGRPVWTAATADMAKRQFPVLWMARLVKNVNNDEPLGVLVFGIKYQSIVDLMRRHLSDETDSISLYLDSIILTVTGTEETILDAKPRKDTQEGEAQSILKEQFKDRHFLTTYWDTNDMEFLYRTPDSSFRQGLFTLVLLVLFSSMIGVFLLMPLVYGFLQKMIRPIRFLTEKLEKMREGHFEQLTIDYPYDDEITQLVEGYNHLAEDNEELKNSVYRLQISERNAEIKALQAQIEPHFLYNTLDILFWKIYDAMHPDAQAPQMVLALSKMFRLTLNRGREMFSIAESLELSRHYLYLQQQRFPDRFTYEYRCDESLYPLPVPKLLLQPLVENAVLHGLGDQKELCRIDVIIRVEGEYLQIIVQDTGCGIPSDILEKLRKGSPASENGSGYALQNIRERLELYYNHDYRFDISSILGGGTTVTMEIPCPRPLGKEEL